MSPRRATSLLIVTVLALGLPPVAAHAADVGGVSTGFEIDGNKLASGAPPGAFDWSSFLSAPVPSSNAATVTPTGPYTTSQGNASTGILDASFAWDNGSSAAACGPGSGTFADASASDSSQTVDTNPWVVGTANVAGNVDLCSTGSAYEIVTTPAGEQHVILYQYLTRRLQGGSLQGYQYLEGGAAGRCDDYLIQFDYEPSDTTFEVNILAWSGACTAGASGSWQVTPQGGSVAVPAAFGTRTEGPGTSIEGNTFIEWAVDLSAAGVFDSSRCIAFGVGEAMSNTGNATGGGQIKDFLDPGMAGAGGDGGLTIANCGSLTVEKEVAPAGSADGVAFPYTVSRTAGGVVLEGGGTTLQGQVTTSGATTHVDLLAASDYTLVEDLTGLPLWALTSVVCEQGGDTYVLVDDGEPTGATFPIVVGATTACTIANTTSFVQVTKETLPDGADASFDFTATGQAPFSLADGDRRTFQYAPGSAVTVTEALPAGWRTDAVACTLDGAPTGTAVEGGVSVVTTAGATTDCTFTNEGVGTITVQKVTDPVASDADVEFALGGLPGTTGFTLNAADPATATWSSGTVRAGSYTVAEVLPADSVWYLGDLTCTDPSGGTAVDVADATASIALDPGDDVVCTFRNVRHGSITVTKVTDPAGADVDLDFTLAPEGGASQAFVLNPANDPTRTFDGLRAGTWTIAEAALPEGWQLRDLTCTGAEVSIDLAAGTAVVTLLPGAAVACTFSNVELGSITIVKETAALAGGPLVPIDQDFTFQGPGATVVLNTGASADGTASTTSTLLPGSYGVAEDEAAGWDLASLTCLDGDDPVVSAADGERAVTVDLAAGQDVVCTFRNEALPAELTVTKTVEGLAPGVPWSFDVVLTASDASTRTGTLTDDEPAVTWVGLVPGEVVTISEVGVTGWTLGELTCDAPDADPETDGYQVRPLPGQVLACSLTNSADPATLTVTKTTLGGDGTFAFVLEPAGDAEADPITIEVTTSGGTGQGIEELVPGTVWTLAEVDPGADWIAGEVTCTITRADGGTVAVGAGGRIVTMPGDAVACGATNTRTGTVVVVKNVEGADGDFTFDGSWLEDRFVLTTVEGTAARTFSSLVPGAYTLAEVEGPGWSGTDLICSDGAAVDGLTAAIDLAPGATVVCTFTNTEWGTLVVDKVTDPVGSPQGFAFTTDAGDPFALTDGADPHAFGRLEPGRYEVTETATDGWRLTDLSCVGAEGGAEADGTSVSVAVGLRKTVVCTFTNTQRQPLTLAKRVEGAPVLGADGTHTVVYTVVVTNPGVLEESYDLEDRLRLGTGITVVDASVTSADGVAVDPGWDGVDAVGIAQDVALAGGTSHTYTVTVVARVPVTLTSEVADCVITGSEQGTGFLNGARLSMWSGEKDATACVPVPVTDVSVVKDGPASITVAPSGSGTSVTYTLTATNLGDEDALDVVLVDTLPSAARYVSVTGATCTAVGGRVTCPLGDLAPGQVRAVTITVTYPAGTTAQTVRNVADVTTRTPETTTTNNRDHHDVRIDVPRTVPTAAVTPRPRPALPATGADGTLALASAGLLLVLGGVVLRRRRGRSA